MFSQPFLARYGLSSFDSRKYPPTPDQQAQAELAQGRQPSANYPPPQYPPPRGYPQPYPLNSAPPLSGGYGATNTGFVGPQMAPPGNAGFYGSPSPGYSPQEPANNIRVADYAMPQEAPSQGRLPYGNTGIVPPPPGNTGIVGPMPSPARGVQSDTPIQKFASGGRVMPPRSTSILGQMHHLAYINDEEADLLRQRGGGLDSQGNQILGPSRIPAYLSADRERELAERAERGIDNSGGFGGEGGFQDATRGMNRGWAADAAQRAITRGIMEGDLDKKQYDAYRAARESGDIATAGAFGRAARDYLGSDDDIGDRISNALAGSFGFNERNPFTDKTYSGGTRSNWGLDPAGLIGGAVGTAFGIPGVGLAADKLSSLLGRPFEIGLGPDVLGGFGGATGTAGGLAGAGGERGEYGGTPTLAGTSSQSYLTGNAGDTRELDSLLGGFSGVLGRKDNLNTREIRKVQKRLGISDADFEKLIKARGGSVDPSYYSLDGGSPSTPPTGGGYTATPPPTSGLPYGSIGTPGSIPASAPAPSGTFLNPYFRLTPNEPQYIKINQRNNFARGGFLEGPTHGKADMIPARLSDGEYVIDAMTVAKLGGGNNKRGAKVLDQMRSMVAKMDMGGSHG